MNQTVASCACQTPPVSARMATGGKWTSCVGYMAPYTRQSASHVTFRISFDGQVACYMGQRASYISKCSDIDQSFSSHLYLLDSLVYRPEGLLHHARGNMCRPDNSLCCLERLLFRPRPMQLLRRPEGLLYIGMWSTCQPKGLSRRPPMSTREPLVSVE